MIITEDLLRIRECITESWKMLTLTILQVLCSGETMSMPTIFLEVESRISSISWCEDKQEWVNYRKHNDLGLEGETLVGKMVLIEVDNFLRTILPSKLSVRANRTSMLPMRT